MEKVSRWSKPLEEVLERWKTGTAPCRLDVVQRKDDSIVVHDTRPTRIRPRFYFKGLEKEIIEFCDQPRSISKINEFVEGWASPSGPSDNFRLQEFLDHLVWHRLMIRSENSYLSVILPEPVAPPMQPR